MSRSPIVAGNWKMNTTLEEALELSDALRETIGGLAGVESLVCPPFVWLIPVAERLRDSSIGVGAQNTHWAPKGAFTGEVSPLMLASLCRYVIVGHSERRQHFGETDETVNRKVRAAIAHNLLPIVCVGETLAENEAGRTFEVVSRQTRAALAEVPPTEELVVAYEPVWAIGTGRAATSEGAAATIGDIRRVVGDVWGVEVAARLRIQYGGSVTPANAAELFAQPEIDGALVGGASLRAADFAAIVRAALMRVAIL
ncbi:MAG TPA: triose-phosphate isomerase [Chloroflexota bacterium]